jgi:hypothetical protein
MTSHTITVTLPAQTARPTGQPGQLLYAIQRRDTLEARDSSRPVLVIKRTDHPRVDGNYYYAIRADEKHAWTPGETVLDADGIAGEWYAADCPEVM